MSPARRGSRRPTPTSTTAEPEVSPLTLNRLSIYLRSLTELQEGGISRISSQDLARRFRLSATQIRKDLAQFGEFGIRGVGYDVQRLADRLSNLLGLHRSHPIVICGVGNLGSALARYWGFNYGPFRVVAAVDTDPQKVGKRLASFTVGHPRELKRLIKESSCEIGVLAVPASAAVENYDALVSAGIRAVINFAPLRLEPHAGVRVKNVDLRINLEEVAFFLGG
ncbi:MAG: redox-sensing transcriptional repressor Rex [Acidobacteriota bacterium]